MSEQMRNDFEAWAKPDSVQKRRTGCGSGYEDVGMDAGWSAWQAAKAESQEEISELEEAISRLHHDLKNAECAAELQKHLADQYALKAKRLTEELSLFHAQEPA